MSLNDVPEDLNQLNITELAYIIRRQTGMVVKRSVPKERLVDILENGKKLEESEICYSTETRKKLQVFIEKNWKWVESQLPCKGENRGKCTVYNCPEGRHADCLIGAGPQLSVHSI